MDTTVLKVGELSIAQMRYLIREEFEAIAKEQRRIAEPAIKGKKHMWEFLGIGRELFDRLNAEGVWQGVVLQDELCSRTYTAFPDELRKRYTDYILGAYKPTKPRHFKPKASTKSKYKDERK